uniref:Uncharacterized protein n=1 Tax=Arundo donax TaxID=35708 RepID=A0A0A8YCR6_ARUDO
MLMWITVQQSGFHALDQR